MTDIEKTMKRLGYSDEEIAETLEADPEEVDWM